MKILTSLTWIPCEIDLPDESTTVLVAITGDSEPVWLGYLDECEWHSVDGLLISGQVTHWAEIVAPASLERSGLIRFRACAVGANVTTRPRNESNQLLGGW